MEPSPSPAPAPPALAIQVRGLVKRFDDTVAVAGIDFEVRSGQCVGLLGPNGAGKTTTVEILEGLQKPTAGEVRLLGRSWEKDEAALRERIGLALQETRFYERLTVEETVRLFRSFYKQGLEVEEAIALVRLEEKRGAHSVKLSGGQRQRLALAVALVSDPELLFLDEPTTGLDPQSRRALWDVIEGLKGKGRTVVLTTHYMEEAQVLCDQVIIMDHGRIVGQGTPAELIASIGGDQVIEFATTSAFPVEAFADIPTYVSHHPRGEGHTLTVKELHRALPGLLSAVSSRGTQLRYLSTRQATLDDVFLALTGRSLREDNAS
ncbi:ABC transporter ATP-binding protein [Hyalangium rubrum]|uniref:ABC transporter ATP-binding protein n=1 Tax=Hyalangium rubrum TaxID=3103134 RepID=A0ABU5HBB9_9BACT|nr:ABC transporter ATP-binding protein [Hyalangium sp. s54d21]MDY7230422.1 ABC transporter ATP-binding protein [Hyalangium sp. s54d21]